MRIAMPLVTLLCVTVHLAASADGRLEFNQASVDAAGGFPVTISEPGSYLLTGNLLVPADTDAFVLMTSGVVFDLNGFTIAGPATCSGSGCSAGTGMAIRGFSGIAHARDTTVRNGIIRGFGDNCVRLGSGAYVTDLRVTECGRNGISVAGGSLVKDNRVTQTGEHGISMSSVTPAFAQNTVSSAGLGGGGFSTVTGGRATAGNVCDDARCDPTVRRHYYLSVDPYAGDEALQACDAGFHMASIDEIMFQSTLRYDTVRGRTQADSGSAAPHLVKGWVRTGYLAYNSAAGWANCEAWTSSSSLDKGTTALLRTDWDGSDPGLPGQEVVGGSLWLGQTDQCQHALGVWCVED